jgi:hypothetical protein
MAEWTAITGADVKDIRFALTPEGVDPAKRQTLLDNFGSYGFTESDTALKNLVNSSTVMNEVANSTTAMSAISASSTAMNEISKSQTAMDELSASSTAMNEISESQTAMNELSASSTAMNTVSSSRATMDTLLASQTARDAISASTTAMDSVSASQTARNAVNDNNTFFNKIGSLPMAIGKFLAGSMGLTPTNYADITDVVSDTSAMDTVSASQTAMDTVSVSQAAMDAVSASVMPRTASIGSQYAIDTLWSTPTGSETWLGGYQVQTGASYQSIINSPASHNGSALQMSISDASDTSTRGWTIDPNNYSTLEWKDKITEGVYGGGKPYVRVKLDGNVIYSKEYFDSTSNWTTRSVDISTYSAESDLVIEADTSNGLGSNGITLTAQFGDIVLS